MIKKSMLAMAVLAAFAIGAPSTALCATKKDKPATPDPAKAAETTKSIPYHGKVASVDAAAKTFTIKGLKKDRLFSTTDKTVITKDGAPADIAAITVGEEVQGSAKKSGDNWEALKITIVTKDAKAAKAGGKKEEAKPADTAAPAAAKPADGGNKPADATPPAAAPTDAPPAAAPPADAPPAK